MQTRWMIIHGRRVRNSFIGNSPAETWLEDTKKIELLNVKVFWVLNGEG